MGRVAESGRFLFLQPVSDSAGSWIRNVLEALAVPHRPSAVSRTGASDTEAEAERCDGQSLTRDTAAR